MFRPSPATVVSVRYPASSFDNGPDGEDAYIEGKLDVDGMIYADGGVTGNVTGTATGLAIASQAAGDILYFTGTIWERLAKNEGKYLKSGASAVSWDTPPAAGTPTVITVADEAADASSFPLFVTAATGDLGPKTDTAYTYDPTTGTVGATKFSGAFNGTIGATTPAAGTFTSVTIAKSSGVAGDLGLYEANSTDTHAAGFRGPDSITGDGAYRIKFPDARAAAAGQVLAVTNAGESGTGTAADPYVQTGSWITPKTTDIEKLAVFTWDGGGSALTAAAGTKRCAFVPAASTLTGLYFSTEAEGTSDITVALDNDAFAAGAHATTDWEITTGPTNVVTIPSAGTVLNVNTTSFAATAISAGDQICATITATDTTKWLQLTLYGTK